MSNFTYSDHLAHHGVLGMKWGIRRYQNPDGTLTPLGRSRLRSSIGSYRFAEKGLKPGADKEFSKLTRNSVLKNTGRQLSLDFSKVGEKSIALSKYYHKLTGKKYVEDTDDLPDDEKFNEMLADFKKSRDEYKETVKTYADNLVNDLHLTDLSDFEVERSRDIVNNALDKIATGEYFGWVADSFVEERNPNISSKYYIEEQSISYYPGGADTRAKAKRMVQEHKHKEAYTYTPEQKAQKLENAKKSGNYDMYFMEAIQNSKIFKDNNTSAINREYKKYLDDPDDYFLNGREKLEPEGGWRKKERT